MSRRRSRIETMNAILLLALDGVLKTHIMYRANLSHDQLNKYLGLLLEHRLLRRQEDRYVTTMRGRTFVNTFREIQLILGETSTVRNIS